MNLNENIERILVSKEEIAKRTAELGDRISRDYKGKRPLLVCVLKGSVMFFSDLVRRITEDVELDFMAISSYGSGSTSSGEVRVLKDLGVKVEGRDLLVIEDIVDSGITLYYLTNLLKTRGAASVEICTLLDKPERRQRDLKPKYVGFTIPNEFVVGYGLDYDKLRSTFGTTLYRETQDIYVVAVVLGHKDINTTKKHYAAISDEIRRKAANVIKLRENDDK